MKKVPLVSLLLAFSLANGLSQQTSNPRYPAVIHECDIVEEYKIRACVDWKISGVGRYSGTGAEGFPAILTVEHFDQTNISIHREDVFGSGVPNLTADYHGEIENGRIFGTFTIHKFGAAYSGIWKATLEGIASEEYSRLPPKPMVAQYRVLRASSLPVTYSTDGPAEVSCLNASQRGGGPDDPPAKCFVTGPGLATAISPNGGYSYTSGPGDVTLTCRGNGVVHCSIQVKTPVAKP